MQLDRDRAVYHLTRLSEESDQLAKALRQGGPAPLTSNDMQLIRLAEVPMYFESFHHGMTAFLFGSAESPLVEALEYVQGK